MRVQVNLNDDIVKKIDEYGKAIGVSRSALCATWIGQSVLSLDKSMDIIEKMGIDVAKTLKKNEVVENENSGK